MPVVTFHTTGLYNLFALRLIFISALVVSKYQSKGLTKKNKKKTGYLLPDYYHKSTLPL